MGASDWPDEVIQIVHHLALQNAVEYNGKGQVGSVMGRVLGERPELRSQAKEIASLIASEVQLANARAEREGVAKLRDELADADPSRLEKRKATPKREGFPELPNAERGHVVLRFAPNPNGPLTLGHSRGLLTNSIYAKNLEGRLILRFDDTDTRVKPPHPEAYQWILEDTEWLIGRNPDEVIMASDRIQIYHKYAVLAIEKGLAYVDLTPANEFREMRIQGNLPADRDLDCETHLARWNSMLDGTFSPGEAVVRIRTSAELTNPALRDWPALRIQEKPHPREQIASSVRVWPLLDFQSAIDDHLCGVTHIIRGKDLMDSTRRQTLLYEGLGWTYPETIYWGRVKIHGYGKFSTSGMREDIEQGRVTGWDDPRLPTLRALKRRGISPVSLHQLWSELGLTAKDISASMETLSTFNARIIDSTAHRAMFVRNPRRIRLKDSEHGSKEAVHLPIHPDRPELGVREIMPDWDDGFCEVILEPGDLSTDSVIRLRGWANVKVDDLNPDGTASGRWLGGKRDPKIVQAHWLPLGRGRLAQLTRVEDENIIIESGMLEWNKDHSVGDILQLERIGFAIIERISDDGVELMFTHR